MICHCTQDYQNGFQIHSLLTHSIEKLFSDCYVCLYSGQKAFWDFQVQYKELWQPDVSKVRSRHGRFFWCFPSAYESYYSDLSVEIHLDFEGT